MVALQEPKIPGIEASVDNSPSKQFGKAATTPQDFSSQERVMVCRKIAVTELSHECSLPLTSRSVVRAATSLSLFFFMCRIGCEHHHF